MRGGWRRRRAGQVMRGGGGALTRGEDERKIHTGHVCGLKGL